MIKENNLLYNKQFLFNKWIHCSKKWLFINYNWFLSLNSFIKQAMYHGWWAEKSKFQDLVKVIYIVWET